MAKKKENHNARVKRSRTKAHVEDARGSRRSISGWLFLFLWVACMASALQVVYDAYETRKYIQSLEVLRAETVELRIRSGEFHLEKSALASYPRIEKIATQKLNMIAPNANETILVVRKSL